MGGCCGGGRKAKLQGRTPTSSKMVAWIVVMQSGDVSEYGSEIEARAALAASGGRGNVVRKRA